MNDSVTFANSADDIDERVEALLSKMSLAEKAGQMSQLNSPGRPLPDAFVEDLRAGRVGSILNEVDVRLVNELQRIVVEESRLGIPLLVGRDVIHGFATIMPIPIGLAATWNPEIVRRGAEIAAAEAATVGINWTFAPMIDITRDPRWGRIAESPGEDPYLSSLLAVAMVEGFQGEDLARPGTIAACAKHFAGYGAAESGRDYNTTNIPENELRNVYLRPFKAAVDAGVATMMASFSDLDGVPATGNRFLMTDILRGEWGYEGFVVSDWNSIPQLSIHGLTEDDEGSAYEALNAGVAMEMASGTYIRHIGKLVDEGRISEADINAQVRAILRLKFELGLFENPYTDPSSLPAIASDDALAVARESALQSIVLLKNDAETLPLDADRIESLAVIGPLADAPYEQLGTWVFDGDPGLSVTPLEALRERPDIQINYARAMENSRTRDDSGFDAAIAAARASDAVVLFLGEESILSGEAHSRADIGLPGAQAELVKRVSALGKPLVVVILAGRPLTLLNIIDEVDAILFAWHPGTMGGPAIADLLFGDRAPSGRLPVSFPKMVGQVPIYYNEKNTGKPATPDTVVHIDDIDPKAPQTSFGMTAFHLDAGYKPLYTFGHGLSYTEFEYRDIEVDKQTFKRDESLTISAELENVGDREAVEIAQLYVRDLVGNVTRPIRELKGFRRISLKPGEKQRVEFRISADDLAFYGREQRLIVEPGLFHAWIGGSSEADLQTSFRLVD